MEKKFTISAKKYKGETSVVSLRLPNDLIKDIESISQKTGRSKNEVISMGLEFAINNIEIEEN